MATFRVGQRVKRIREAALNGRIPIGCEGAVAAHDGGSWVDVHWDTHVGGAGIGGSWSTPREYVAPLTDPKADEFIERIKKMKVYDEPTVKTRVTEGIQ